jgi:hypothetical protein
MEARELKDLYGRRFSPVIGFILVVLGILVFFYESIRVG